MSYIFTPKSEEECQAENMCPEGEGLPFTVLDSAEVESKNPKNAGRSMIKLKLAVHARDGFDYHVYDYVADWFLAFKFRHFFYSVGMAAQYEKGEVTASDGRLKGKQGFCNIEIEPAKNGYQAKNKVGDYVPNPNAPTASFTTNPPAITGTSPATPAPGDDDVPF